MPSFTIFDSSTTAQTLDDGQTGYVGPNGALVTSASAITTTGDCDLTVMGSVTSFFGSAIKGSADSGDITIGATGQVASMSASVIWLDIAGTGGVGILNYGLLTGVLNGIRLEAFPVTGALLEILNAGTVSGTSDGVYVTNASGSVTIVNTGTIATLRPATS
jgi:hypothetical protein